MVCRAEVEAYVTVGKHAVTRRYDQFWREEPGPLVSFLFVEDF